MKAGVLRVAVELPLVSSRLPDVLNRPRGSVLQDLLLKSTPGDETPPNLRHATSILGPFQAHITPI